MLHSQLIRTVGNLCLIAAIFVQPLVGVGALASCDAASMTGASDKCGGCGHCEVVDRSERCGCCQSQGSEAKERVTESCCHSEPSSRPHSDDDDSGHDIDVSVQGDVVQHASVAIRTEAATQEHPALSGCMCAVASQPFSPPLPRAPGFDIKEVQPQAGIFSSLWRVPGAACALAAANSLSPAVSFDSLDTHRRLCVWRL